MLPETNSDVTSHLTGHLWAANKSWHTKQPSLPAWHSSWAALEKHWSHCSTAGLLAIETCNFLTCLHLIYLFSNGGKSKEVFRAVVKLMFYIIQRTATMIEISISISCCFCRMDFFSFEDWIGNKIDNENERTCLQRNHLPSMSVQFNWTQFNVIC